MKQLACFLIAVGLSAGSAAMAQDVIGYVKTVSGDAAVVDGGKAVKAVVGTPVRMKNVLKTGAKGAIGVTFKDNTVMSVGADSEVTVDEFYYSPASDNLKFGARISKGVMSMITGAIAKLSPERVSVATPTGTIGVRGTHFAVKVETE